MNANRQTQGLFLLILFFGMGLASYGGPAATPLDARKIQVVALSQDRTTNFNEGFFKSELLNEEEGDRADSFVESISIEGFHNNSYHVKLTKTTRQFNTRSQKSSLYLLNSCFTI